MDKKAQSTLEYFILLGIIIAGLVAMQVYLKRGMQGRLKGYTEQLNDGLAYSPRATNSNSTITRNVTELVSSNSICRDDSGNEIDCFSIPEKERERIRLSDSNVSIVQVTNRSEATLSFADEPQRW